MKLLLILSLLGQHLPDAGTELSVVPCVRGALLQADGGVVDVPAGVWFSEAENLAMGKDHADLRVQNETYEAHAGDIPLKWIAGTLIVGFALGAALGGATARALPR